MIQKQPQHQENTTRLYPRNRPQDKLERMKAKLLQFPTELKQNDISAIY
jgi:hypothetical protein